MFVLWPVALGGMLLVAAPVIGQGRAEARAAGLWHLTGVVTAVDTEAKTLTVDRMVKGKTHAYSFTAEKNAAAALAGLRTGERVRVSYRKAGGKMTAEHIVDVGRVAVKK